MQRGQCTDCERWAEPCSDLFEAVQFAHILFSLAAFVIFPFTCQQIKARSSEASTGVVLLCICATAGVLAWWSQPWATVYLAFHTGLVFGCPWCLLHVSKFKAKINGPWDEADPRLTTLVKQSSLEAEKLGEVW
jgi:hypothetical protein